MIEAAVTLSPLAPALTAFLVALLTALTIGWAACVALDTLGTARVAARVAAWEAEDRARVVTGRLPIGPRRSTVLRRLPAAPVAATVDPWGIPLYPAGPAWRPAAVPWGDPGSYRVEREGRPW